MSKNDDNSDFTIPSTPCPKAFSTVKRDRKTDLSKQSGIQDSPMTSTNESNTFSGALNVSDLDRDEMYCKQNWSYLPVEKFNFSVTSSENSQIAPPNFMPTGDSLFQELEPSSSYVPMPTPKLSSTLSDKLSEISFMDVKKNESHDQENQDLEIPSFLEISEALRGCEDGASAYALVAEILTSGKKSFSKHAPELKELSGQKSFSKPAPELKELSGQKSFSKPAPELKELSGQKSFSKPAPELKELSGQKSFSKPAPELKELSGQKSFSKPAPELKELSGQKSFSKPAPELKELSGQKSFSKPALKQLSERTYITLEDDITFSCVDINETQSRPLHLLNLNIGIGKQISKFEIRLRGSDAFEVLHSNAFNKDKNMYTISFEEELYELIISFFPKKMGPAVARLKICSGLGRKTVRLTGFGGKSFLIIDSLASMQDFERVLHFTPMLSSEIELHNLGTAAAFYYVNFGALEYYCHIDNDHNNGIVHPGKSKVIKFVIKHDKSVLVKLLNFFVKQNLAIIGNITIHFGEESTRQRIKRLSFLSKDNEMKSVIVKSYPHLLLDYPVIPFNLEEITDNMNSVPLLIHEGIRQMDLKFCLRKDLVNAQLFSALKGKVVKLSQ